MGVWHLHADRLLTGDRRQDADVGRRQGVGEVVLQLRHLGDLRSRREPELIARDMGTGDASDHFCFYAEVPQRLEQAGRDLGLAGGVGAQLLIRRAHEHLGRVRKLPGEARIAGDRLAQPAAGRERGRARIGHAGDLLLGGIAVPAGRLLARRARAGKRFRRRRALLLGPGSVIVGVHRAQHQLARRRLGSGHIRFGVERVAVRGIDLGRAGAAARGQSTIE